MTNDTAPRSPDEQPRVYRESDALPPELQGAGALFQAARDAGRSLVLLVGEDTPEQRKTSARRLHDVKGALRTWAFAIQALEEGYAFQDDRGPAKIAAMRKALQVFEREATWIMRVLAEEPQGERT